MRVLVGRVLRAHGLRGDVLVDPSTDEPRRRFAPGATLYTDDRSLTVAAAAPHGGRWRVRFDEAADRDGAEALRGLALHVDTGDLDRSADPDDFHDAELIGLAVVTVDGRPLGEVGDVLHPAQDLLVVDRPDGSPAYVPFVKALVPSVDVAAGRLVVDPPPGLLDEEG
ncbi:MAG: ribosome maturation factor RimM [Streptosporangiales bacterium]|nr:ribosome maturation factor RimM [Streptosporangiales bacterium]MBO0892195.1 ribosome maturation factor RimM [Acidothermales bacterium]